MDSRGWDERYGTTEYVWTDTVNQFVERHLADLEPGRAIDLGAGEGRNAVWLARRGWEVTAVDFSPVGLEKGRLLAADHGVAVEFVTADATIYRPDFTADLVVLSYLQLGPDGRRTVLEAARSWLNPGGRVFVIAHDRSNVTDGYGGPPTDEVCYDVDETLAALDGLTVELAEVAERPVSNESGDHVALDTLVMAVLP